MDSLLDALDIPLLLALSSACLMVFLLVGFAVLRMVTKSIRFTNATHLFVAGFVGYMSLSAAIALYYTAGLTMNALIVVLGLVMYLGYRRLERSQATAVSPDNRLAMPVLLQVLVFIAAAVFFLFRNSAWADGSFIFNAAPNDLIFYSRVGNALLNTGIETTNFVEAFLSAQHAHYTEGVARTPYHYMHIWLASFIASVSGTNPILIFTYVLPTAFTWLFVVGLWALAGQLHANAYRNIVTLLLIALFFTLLYFPFFGQHNLGIGTDLWAGAQTPLLSRSPSKYLPMFHLGIAVFLTWKHLNDDLALVLLCIGCCIFPGVLVLLAAVVVYIGFRVFTKRHQLVHYRLSSLAVLVVALVYALLYVLQIGMSGGGNTTAVALNLAEYVRVAINIFVKTNIQLLLLYMPIMGILYWAYRKLALSIPPSSMQYFILGILGLGISITAYAVLHIMSNADAPQLVYMSLILLYLFVIECVYRIVHTRPYNYVAVAYLVLAIVSIVFYRPNASVSPVYDQRYVAQVWPHVRSGQAIGYVMAPERLSIQASSFQKSSTFTTPGSIFAYAYNHYTLSTCINEHLVMPANYFEEKRKSTALFVKYYQAAKAQNAALDDAAIQLSFLKKYAIKVVVVEAGAALPAPLLPLVTQHFVSTLTQEQTYVLAL